MDSHSLRLPGETEEDFSLRAQRAARLARVLVDSALANHDIRRLIADPNSPITLESQSQSPTVRVEYAEAVAIGGIGECLQATRSKHWGNFQGIAPLAPDDPVDPMYVLYLFRENSRYNRRFLQRQRFKQLLGREFRSLVGQAKSDNKGIFLETLSERQAWAIRNRLGLEPAEFWRACRGKLVELADQEEQVYFDFMADD